MTATRRRVSTVDALAALALLDRFSLLSDRVASTTLGISGVPNVDIQVLSAASRAQSLSPTQLADAIGRPRSTTSRAITRLVSQGFLERHRDRNDGRRADLRLSPAGRGQVARFADALGDFFVAGQPTIKEAMLLLGFDPEPPQGEVMAPMELAGQMGGVGGAYVAEVEAVIRPFGILTSVDRYAVVEVAAWGQVRPAQLANALFLTPPGVSSLLDRLEAHGLVTRHQGAVVGDGRGVMVRLTPQGSKAARAVATVFRRHEGALIGVLARTLDLAP